jgi:hypothetical protein
VLTALTAPRMDLMRIRADSMGRNVASVLSAAVRTARQRRVSVVIRIDSVGRRVGVLHDTNANGLRDAGEVEHWSPLDEGAAVADPPEWLLDAPVVSGTSDLSGRIAAGGRAADGLMLYLTADASDARAWRALRLSPGGAQVELWRFDGVRWSRART